jgi:hypothetical protein
VLKTRAQVAATSLLSVAAVGASSVLSLTGTAYADSCLFRHFPQAPTGAPAYEGFPFNVELVQDNGVHVYLQTTDTEVQKAMYVKPFAPELVGQTLVTGGYPNPEAVPVQGAADGGIHGGFSVAFKVIWENGFTNQYTGQVNADNSASGTTVNNGGTSNSWHSAFKDFTCAPSARVGDLVGPQQNDDTRADLDRRVDVTVALPDVTATVVSDVDVYTAKNEPDGAGQVVGMLKSGESVKLAGPCTPDSWCEVTGTSVPGGHGWVWGHLNLT